MSRSNAINRLAWICCAALALLVGCASEPVEVAEAEPPEAPPVEMEIGDFRFRMSDPTAGTMTKFNFTLYGLVPADQAETVQAALTEREQRLRDRVLRTAREASPVELEDPDLNMFRKRMLLEINRELGEKYFQELYFDRYWVKTR
ncbi:flagellar basal body-associated FliL family protein [Blastopirellula marina]|uniref:Flagellar protein FliL n=1 Tax=Blastopirellula marina TaxID=124 RepID=A0A2S8GUD4_9BACT|nr:flagellar basal body-associated FliL family protein [Blastopirellula marina]PQO35226.1 hypothetical protein C5Y98_14865 [Blastopirellula marina]PQO48016.1 hypothetical protein C5Y93_01110 [Blastopirellula marina]PTL43975.1 hypothetical protein C5Y97_14875 [Blastopirellula marina]